MHWDTAAKVQAPLIDLVLCGSQRRKQMHLLIRIEHCQACVETCVSACSSWTAFSSRLRFLPAKKLLRLWFLLRCRVLRS